METVCFASLCDVFAFTITAAPPAARERQMARPMFRAPPVTSATFPASSVPGVIPISAVTRSAIQVREEQQQAAEDAGVAEQDDTAGVALARVLHLPEAMEDRRRRYGESDEAVDADFRLPVGEEQGATAKLQRDADPEYGGWGGCAEGGHALDVIANARPGEVAKTGDEEASDDQQPSRCVQPRSVSVHRQFSL